MSYYIASSVRKSVFRGALRSRLAVTFSVRDGQSKGQIAVSSINIYMIISRLCRASGGTSDCLRFSPNSARNLFGARAIAFSPVLRVGRVPQPPPRLFPARARSGRAPPPSASTPRSADLAEMALRTLRKLLVVL